MTLTVSCYGKDGDPPADPSKPGLPKPFTYSKFVPSVLIATNRFPKLVPNLIRARLDRRVRKVDSVAVSLEGYTVGIVDAPTPSDRQTQYLWIVAVPKPPESMGESVDDIKDVGDLTVTITTSDPRMTHEKRVSVVVVQDTDT